MKLKGEILLAMLAGCSLLAAPVGAQDITRDVAQSQNISATVELSPAAAEVVRMAQTGVDESVLLTNVSNSTALFKLSGDAEAVVYLRDVGITAPVISAMISHDSTLATQPNYNFDQKLYANGGQNYPTNQLPVSASQPQPTTPPPATAPPPQYVQNAPPEVNYFYDDLTPYGSWVQLEGYGWCWQPSVVVVNRAWRPYCDSGHWVYTDAGWYWQSDYSWGWAPFHYGRWHMHERVGWVWFPDTVWSPAWVTWRYSGDHCGWAPLPWHSTFVPGVGFHYNGVSVGVNFDFGLRADCFTFVAFGNFFQHDIRRNCLPTPRVTQVINNTTIINNYTVKNNNVVVNNGVPVDRVAAATHTQVRTVAIQNVPAGSRAAASAVNRPNTATRQELHSRVKTAPVVAQKVDEQNPVVRHPVTTTVAKAPTTTATPARANVPPGQVRRGEPGNQAQPTASGTTGRSNGRGQSTGTPTATRGQTQNTTPSVQSQPTTVDRGNGNGRGRGQTATPTSAQPSQVVPTDRGNGRGRGQSAAPVPAQVPPSQPPASVSSPAQPVTPVPPVSQPQTVPSSPSVQRGNPHVYSPKGGTYSSPSMSRPAPPSPSPATPPSSVALPSPSEYRSSAQPADNRSSSPKSHGHEK